MHRPWLRVCQSLLWCLSLFPAMLPVQAQLLAMTPSQGRQIMLTYVSLPDTTIATRTVTDISIGGHTEYLYYGDHGGEYRIDAITAEKRIHYGGLSGADHTRLLPATPFTGAQLLQIALNYVAQHFPNYQPGMFQTSPAVTSPAAVTVDDVNDYYVRFRCPAASGADQPLHCLVIVREDTGTIKDYDETAIPVTVNTTPALRQDQALQIGQNWIAQNISSDPAAGRLNTGVGRAQIQFRVDVDLLLNEALLYEICYNALVLDIDAQTGAIIGSDSYFGATSPFISKPTRQQPDIETMLDVKFHFGTSALQRSAIAVHGQTYLWENYLKWIGIRVKHTGEQLSLSIGDKQMSFALADSPGGTEGKGWRRKDGIYLPVVAVKKLVPLLGWEFGAHEVILISAPPAKGPQAKPTGEISDHIQRP